MDADERRCPDWSEHGSVPCYLRPSAVNIQEGSAPRAQDPIVLCRWQTYGTKYLLSQRPDDVARYIGVRPTQQGTGAYAVHGGAYDRGVQLGFDQCIDTDAGSIATSRSGCWMDAGPYAHPKLLHNQLLHLQVLPCLRKAHRV